MPTEGFTKSDKAMLLRLACQSMSNQLVIMGIPEVTGGANENLSEFALKLASALNVNVSPTDIVRIERMGRIRKRLLADGNDAHVRSRAIMFELSTKIKCDQIITAKKLQPDLNASAIDVGYCHNKVYINRRQPLELQKLREQILKKYPTLTPKMVWIADAGVYLRKNADSKPIKLISSADLSQLDL
ncbi:uncharacterized protein LOC107269298 isoform X2 [Cephus cinctus]|uniref:Uncharacterized protein LOC107269298 isoform X2 n=1 Tax=Cephus cinctus TaxID=211228 RepID=A0AAJ7C0R1_CEPCN|nr:uncharacterized protein LOC107269298 isoform X2 [Cephus cinctus]